MEPKGLGLEALNPVSHLQNLNAQELQCSTLLHATHTDLPKDTTKECIVDSWPLVVQQYLGSLITSVFREGSPSVLCFGCVETDTQYSRIVKCQKSVC